MILLSLICNLTRGSGGFVSYSFGITVGDKSIFCKVNINAHAEEMYELPFCDFAHLSTLGS